MDFHIFLEEIGLDGWLTDHHSVTIAQHLLLCCLTLKLKSQIDFACFVQHINNRLLINYVYCPPLYLPFYALFYIVYCCSKHWFIFWKDHSLNLIFFMFTIVISHFFSFFLLHYYIFPPFIIFLHMNFSFLHYFLSTKKKKKKRTPTTSNNLEYEMLSQREQETRIWILQRFCTWWEAEVRRQWAMCFWRFFHDVLLPYLCPDVHRECGIIPQLSQRASPKKWIFTIAKRRALSICLETPKIKQRDPRNEYVFTVAKSLIKECEWK